MPANYTPTGETPLTVSLPATHNKQIVVTLFDALGSTLPPVASYTWGTSNAGVVTIPSNSGQYATIHGVAAGTAVITVTEPTSGLTMTLNVTVTPNVSPSAVLGTMQVGEVPNSLV